METADLPKMYGLFIPKKANKGTVLKPSRANVFGDDSDEEVGAAAVNQMVNRESARAKIKKQTQLEIDKALHEDPSVYEYDAIYDNIQAQKVSTDVKEGHRVDKKPKYISGLLKMAEVRQREEERRIERKVQKEREEEGDQFADKEAFVTSAYKQKMLEQQAEAEKERREAAMEEMLDVTKQKDMSGFYRYLYREKTGTALTGSEDTDKAEDKVKVKEEPHSDSENENSSSARDKRHGTEKHGRHTAKPGHRSGDKRRDSDDDEPPSLSKTSGSPAHKPSRHGSKSREKDHRRRRDRHSRSPSPSDRRSDKQHRHRSRSRDRRRRDRSSSRDRRSGQKSRSGEMSRSGEISRQHEKDNDMGSRKESKRRHDSSGDERSPSVEKKDMSAKTSSPDRASSPEMLPARPPDEDLDRDDSMSESESSPDEAAPDTKDRDQDSESRERKKEEPPKSSEGEKKEESLQVKYGRKTTEEEVLDARQRFLARKLARERRPNVLPE